MLLKLLIIITAVFTVTAQKNLTPFGTANQSSVYGYSGGTPENAVKPPISNHFDWTYCTHTDPGIAPAWWMFRFNFEMTYITDITIYYREGFVNMDGYETNDILSQPLDLAEETEVKAIFITQSRYQSNEVARRMSGFKLYISNTSNIQQIANTSNIQQDSYLCYEDPVNGTFPNITQTITCNQLGQYVIYYDDTGSNDNGTANKPIVELCYVAIHGCRKTFWGSNCSKHCSDNCIDQHCYPENGSCVWGCNCLDGICNENTAECISGCHTNRTGIDCNKYNLATDGLVSLNSNSSEPFSQVNDGNFSSCFKIPVLTTWIQIDIKERSTVTEIFLVFRVNTKEEGNHTIYASDTNSFLENLIVLKQFKPTETTEIKINAVFRYLFYVPPFSEVLLCEIGIVGCPPTQFGPLCTKPCPVNCSGPCHLETGHCTYGCLNGSAGDTCELGCRKTLWGSNCSKHCSKNCIDQHCYPENGSCVWGCNCLGGICYAETTECIDGCNANRTGIDCNKYNLATDGLVSLNSNSSEPSSQVNDGNFSSCFNIMSIHGLKTWLEIDIKERSIVTEIFLVFGAHTTEEGNHTIYASDTNGSLENATVLKQFELTETTEIKIDATSKYLFYVPPFFKVNLCEIGIVGCPPTQFGPLCTKPCPVNCSGPCHLETGHCTYGCLNGSIGDTCELDSKCYNRVADNNVLTCKPEIYKINPSSGPVNGGTLVTITGRFIGNANDNVSADFDGVRCHNVTVQTPYTNLTCLTGKNSASVTNISVSVHGKRSGSNSLSFRYQTPTISKFFPKNGIQSGNTTVTITGHNISYEGQNRYNISFYDNTTRIECSTIQSTFNPKTIKCKTGKSDVSRNMSRLQVVIDDLTILTITETFQYLPDPKFTLSNESRKAQQSGGATFTIRGDGFNNVGEITVDRVDKPCDVPEDTSAVCETPTKLENQSNSQTVYVRFDGLTLPVTIDYVDDPTFEKFPGVYEYDKESPIEIKGTNILNGAQPGDYSIQIGLDGSCINPDITMQLITCLPPKSVPRTNQTDVNTVYVIVYVGRIKAYIGDLKYQEDVQILAIIVGVLAAALVTAVVIGISAVVFLRKKKKRIMKKFKMELMTREEMIRKASREEFADAQMNIRDIKSDLVTTRVPFCDYQTYVLHLLFPNQDIQSNPLLHDSEITDDKKTGIQSAMEKLETLLLKKLFLKSLVQTLDRPNMLTMQEKAHFSSVLSISLLGNMRLFFELVHCLLVDLIRTSTKKNQKSLFRRLDSITMRLMVNWLQTGLYKQLKSHSGMQLFMLYKAVQTIIEMAPVDALTSNSKNTIAEEKLLKMRIEHQTLTLQIDLNGNSDQHYPVKVLDCDTISQVKQKCCAQIYKNKPASEIPHNEELSLEWQEGRSGKLRLNDIDNTSDRNNGLICLNTLKHYMVRDNCKMVLMYKHIDEEDVYANSSGCRTESVTSEDIILLVSGSDGGEDTEKQKWHLETCSPNLPDDIKSNRESDFGDIFLNRLFHTKLLLTDYIDSTFEGLIDSQSLSIPIRYFLCMLDKFGNDYKIESDVVQAWKKECYAARVWAPFIAKPDILFDVNVPGHVEPCLDILRQVFVESFTQTAHKVNKESPPQKLLFHKDIPRYRKLIAPFFVRVEPVNEQELLSELEEISNTQKAELKFSRQSTLHHLYNLFIGKYKSEIIDDFEDMEESKDLQFAHKLEEVIDLMEEFSSDF